MKFSLLGVSRVCRSGSSPTAVLFALAPPLSSHHRHPRATYRADRREALTANFSVSLAKCGESNTARKICQIALWAILLITGCRCKCLLFIPFPNTPPTPPERPRGLSSPSPSPSPSPEGEYIENKFTNFNSSSHPT